MRTLRVATLNVWNKQGPWSKRLEVMRAEIQRYQPDVIGLQEVLRLSSAGAPTPQTDQASEIADGLGYPHIAYGEASDYGNGLKFGNAILSRFPVLESTNVRLPNEGTDESRALLFGLLDTPGGRLPTYVTHLNWKLDHGYVRLAQTRAIANAVTARATSDDNVLPAVLMGDFNADPDSDEIRYLRGLHTVEGKSPYFADAWWWAGSGGPGYTFDRKNVFAARAHEPPRRIDYIFVKGGPDGFIRGEPLETRLAFDEPEYSADGPIWASDHFGLVTDLMVARRKWA